METSNKANRLISIDLMRGYFLLVIVIDHFGRFPNLLEWVSGRGALWVTAAEGFFFVSGLMLGLTAVRKIKDRGFWPIATKMWQRAGLLYVLAVVTTLIFTYISFQLGWAPKGGLIESRDWLTVINQALTLNYAYGWTDFLPRYTLFMLVAPLAAYLLYRGMWWAVLWTSLLVWVFTGPTNFTYAWQIVFFLGMIAGYYLPQLRQWANSWSGSTQKLVYNSAVAASIVALCTTVLFALVPFILNDYGRQIAPIFDNVYSSAQRLEFSTWLRMVNEGLAGIFHHEQMGFGRIILFNLFFWTAFAVLQKHGHRAAKWLGWLLIPLGKNSLLTYITHASVIFYLDIYVLRQPGIKWNMIHTIAAIALVWLIVVAVSNRVTIWSWVKRRISHLRNTYQLDQRIALTSKLVRVQAGSATKLVTVTVPLLAVAILCLILLLRLLI